MESSSAPKEDGGESGEEDDESRHHVQPAKDGRSRIHRIIRDRIVGSKWFGRIVMFVIILNSLLLWPWTDKAKEKDTDRLPSYDAYPIINFFFILVYLIEFILKVCQCHSLLVISTVLLTAVANMSPESRLFAENWKQGKWPKSNIPSEVRGQRHPDRNSCDSVTQKPKRMCACLGYKHVVQTVKLTSIQF